MDLGLDRAGMTCLERVEWDRAAASVLLHNHPHVPVYADISQYHPRLVRAIVALVAGGSPCQDLSVAGLRAGLDGERSGLFRQMVRVCRALRPRHVLWENVVGALSSNDGRDFAAVIGAFTGCAPEVPADGWGTAGFAPAALPGRWNVAWRVFDSQYFGVPQRRRRVFLVGSLGDGSCVEILFEPESVRGDNPPGRAAGEGVAGTVTPSALDGSGACGGDGRDGMMVTGTMSSRPKGSTGLGTDFDLDGGLQVSLPLLTESKRQDYETQTFVVAGTLQGSGKAAGSATQHDAEAGLLVFDTTQVTSQENRSDPRPGDPCHTLAGGAHPPAIAFSSKDHGSDAGDLSPTLRAMSHSGSHANGGGQVSIANGIGVRRLTPTECERLQAWPDAWTRHGCKRLKLEGNLWRIVDATPVVQRDGPRYRQIGNGVTASVPEWIGKRMMKYAL